MTLSFTVNIPGRGTVEIPYRSFFENVDAWIVNSKINPASVDSAEDKIIHFFKGVYVEGCCRKSKRPHMPQQYVILQNFFDQGFHAKPELAQEFYETIDEYQPFRNLQISDLLATDEEISVIQRRPFFHDVLKFDQYFKNGHAPLPDQAEQYKQAFNSLVHYLSDQYTLHKPVTVLPEERILPEGVENLEKEREMRCARLGSKPRATLTGGERVIEFPVSPKIRQNTRQ